ncbi:Plasmodium vivax Vir protein, putative [Plasmodium vivax]|uniref:Vir protein, putative n=1 Tax=Plasmodium vivax TaxID=5855 RepID=A0A1G4E0Z8_PLAVI|nr:Plasmodium vivax Vir protein, putative [Plasmodium vivax]
MSNQLPKPEYFTYNDYTQVRNKLKTCNYNYNNEEKEDYNKIISRINNNNFVNWKDEFFSCLHHYLTYNNGFMGFGVPYYCRYINLWLNKEVRKPKYQNYQPYFNIFQEFVNNYALVRQNHDRDSCKNYIYYMEDKVYNGMKFLYDFYEFYDELSSPHYWNNGKACEKLSYKSFIYSRAIEDYYENHRDLYDKIIPVKNLIENIINKHPKKCEQSVHFRIPPKFLKDEEIRLQNEEAEKIRRQQEEADKIRKQQEEADKIRKQQEAELEAHKRMLQMPTTLDAQPEIFHQGEPLPLGEQENSREAVNLETQEHSKLLTYRWGSANSGKFEQLKEQGLRQPDEDQLDTRVLKTENEDTNTDGSLLKSFRLPSVITEVLGSVEPAPVLGVSGGMGALFLLFKYTPVGTFFGRRRGRAHGIPRSFNGQFLGGFPGYEEFYDVGFGNGPINISYRPELE